VYSLKLERVGYGVEDFRALMIAAVDDVVEAAPAIASPRTTAPSAAQP
jgi:hypothetical protein